MTQPHSSKGGSEQIIRERYTTQVRLPELGVEGQKKLQGARVVVVGAGGLGSNICNMLGRAGVGNMVVADRDVVELSNLHRQVLYETTDINKPKAEVVKIRMKAINPNVKVTALVCDVNFSNIERLIKNADVVMDGTDNLETRFLINDACTKHRIPWVYGGAIGKHGMTMNIIPGDGPCFRCFLADAPSSGLFSTCETEGVLNTAPAIMGAIQATEAIKIILDSTHISRHLLIYDIWKQEFIRVKVPEKLHCTCCCEKKYEFLGLKKRSLVTRLCGKEQIQVVPIKSGDIDLEKLEKKLEDIGHTELINGTLTLRKGELNIKIFPDGRALVGGVKDEMAARSIYSKYVGM